MTPIAVIANVSRIVTKVVDRIAGDRADYPLLVTRYKINVPSLAAFYDPVRDVARYAGINLEDLIKPR